MNAKEVAWGLVTRYSEGSNQILVARRMKADDPLRQGQLIIPGGGLEAGETYEQAAMREVKQETGIDTRYKFAFPFNLPRVERRDLVAYVDGEGALVLSYLDSGKSYRGKLIVLEPSINQEPVDQPLSDARDPRYLAFEDVFRMHNEFTPACQVLLENLKPRRLYAHA